MRPAICPECAAGKCLNCDGTAWCDETDFMCTCACSAAGHNPKDIT